MAFADSGNGRGILAHGSGEQPASVTLAEDCKAGDVLGYSAGWKRAIGTAGGVIQPRLIALADGKNGGTVPVATHLVVNGYTGATPGDNVYVANGAGNNGKVTTTAPAGASGHSNVISGVCLSATEIEFFLNSRADSVA